MADPDSEAGLKTDNHYDTGSLSALGYKTAGLPANDDDADAFYAKVKKRISKSETVDATLVRPFGQLNVYAKDYDGIPMGNLRPAKVSVSFDGVPSGLDLVNGTVLDPVPMVVDAVSVAESETGDASKGRRMGYNYIFTMAEDGQSHLLEKFSMSFLGEDGTTPVAESYDFPAGIPLQRNYRTNVTGNLLTGGVVVNVELQPVFGGENDENLQ